MVGRLSLDDKDVASDYLDADVEPRNENWGPEDLVYVTIPRMIMHQAAQFGDRELVVDDRRRLTYAEFAEGMTRVERSLMALGVERGDRVAVWAPNSAEWLLAATGATAAGATLLPMNSRFKGAEALDVVLRGGPRVLFTVRNFLNTDYPAMLRRSAGERELQHVQIVVLDGAADAESGDLSFEDFLDLGLAVSEEAAVERRNTGSPDDISDVILTSGTTGRPKGVMTSHRQNILAWLRYAKHFDLRTGERINATLPFFHNFGYKAGFLVAAMLGGTCICEAIYAPAKLAERIQQERISYLKGTPALFIGLLSSPARASADLSSLRICLVAGAMIASELVERMQAELCPLVVAGYGLSELAGGIALTPIDAEFGHAAQWAGSLVKGVEVRIVDEDGHDLPAGEPGEIYARSDCVMVGYLADQTATAASVDSDGWLHTGDVGTISDAGFIRVTDRKNDIFSVGGFNAYPAEIERLLQLHPEIAQAAVVGMPDPRLGEVGAAFVVLAPGSALSPEQIIRWSRENLANFKVPHYVEVLEHLPVNASMKVLKQELRARLVTVGG